MPFDPNLPQAGTEIDAVQMRGQLNGLKTLIDAIGSVTAVVVDAVNTLPPGDPATVSVSITGTTLHFTFGIPAGQTGATGPQGSQGEVSQAALDTAISGTSSNSNGVSFLGQIADTSYNQGQMQMLFDKVDELTSALRRP